MGSVYRIPQAASHALETSVYMQYFIVLLGLLIKYDFTIKLLEQGGEPPGVLSKFYTELYVARRGGASERKQHSIYKHSCWLDAFVNIKKWASIVEVVYVWLVF